MNSAPNGLRCTCIRATGSALLSVPLLLAGTVVFAGTLDTTGQLSQSDFETLAKNLGAATQYKSIAPIEQLGIIGFDVGIEASSTDIDDAVFDSASGGNSTLDSLVIGRLHAHKGLPFGLDIGASLGTVVDTDMLLVGAELRYALVEGDVAIPAVGVRATYSIADGNDDIDVENLGLEIGISKGFLMLTPYAGAGLIRTTLTPLADDSLQNEENVNQKKLFVGLNVNLGINLTFEADRTGDYTTYSAKAGLRF